MTDEKKVSTEVAALLRYYTGRKLIATKDIQEFSEEYKMMQVLLKDTVEPQ